MAMRRNPIVKHLRTFVAAVMASLLWLAPEIARACASCGLDANDKSAAAYKTSVLAMLAGPYLTVFAVGGVIYLVWRKSKREAGNNH
jgi:hypothetical protein